MRYRGLKFLLGVGSAVAFCLAAQYYYTKPGSNYWIVALLGIAAASNLWFAIRMLTRP